MATDTAGPQLLPWTGDDEADRLIATDPLALLIGFALDQQVTVQKAFHGPLELRRRLGHLDASRIAAAEPEELSTAFRTPPAIHRFPGAMAERVQALCLFVNERYGGDVSRIWREAGTGEELRARLAQLPGFGDMKVGSLMAVLTRQYGIRPPGWETHVPSHRTLGDCATAEQLAEYQAAKRARKAAMRAQRAADA